MASKMFSFITATWNPLGGECLHHCSYCWARKLAERYGHKKYKGKPRIYAKVLERGEFKQSDFVFVCDMCDLLGAWVPNDDVKIVLGRIVGSPAQFLLLTKNPARYNEFLPTLQKTNCLLGVTLETNRDTDTFSKALSPVERWEAFYELEYSPKFVAIEPIMDFDLNIFADWLFNITGLDSVAIGYDNYNNKLPEPPLAKTLQFIDRLEKTGIKVYRKSLREAWNEQSLS